MNDHADLPADPVRSELEAEQAHIDRAYAALDRLREGAAAAGPDPLDEDEGAGGTFQERFERERATADARRRLGELRWGDPPLVFGRIDLEPGHPEARSPTGERFHIGRIGVFDEDHEQLVVDWRAPIAEGFYRATRADPMGLRRRRSFHCRGRRLLGIDDVVFEPDALHDAPVVGEAALLASLEAPRSGRMSDAVATVQAEQDEVIRAPMAGITIVQGAAGTGKTVVALHRAAYLLYTHRHVLDRQGVLVVGPNAGFLDYVRDVLPALGEHDVRLATAAELYPGIEAVSEADRRTAIVKTDLRMVRLLRRAVRMRQRRLRETARVPVGRFVLKLPPERVNAVVDEARRQDGTHNERRPLVEDGLVAAFHAELVRRNTAQRDRMRDPGPDGMRHLLRQAPAFRLLLERVWPWLTPRALLHDLFGSPALLRHAGRDGLLSEREQTALHRPRSATDDDVPWTDADVPLLHEAHALLGPLPRPPAPVTGPTEDEELFVDRVIEGVVASMEQAMDPVMEADLRRSVLEEVRINTGTAPTDPHAGSDVDPDVPRVWGSVIVDEAQDLSPMAWRMVARACPNQAMTIVGDLAQGTRPWSPASWDEVVSWIGARHPARRHELHINYRTPTEIMSWASPFAVSPERALAIRSTGVPPQAVRVEPRHVVPAAATRARALRADIGEGKVALIGPPGCTAQLRALVDDDIEVHTPESVKGLEFDAVVIAEPGVLVDPDVGTAPLYVALTRAMRHLVLVHAGPLPEGLPGGSSGPR